MPTIQIEQDAPDLIARVRQRISELSQFPRLIDIDGQYVRGYVDALLIEGLITRGVHDQLIGELNAVRAAITRP